MPFDCEDCAATTLVAAPFGPGRSPDQHSVPEQTITCGFSRAGPRARPEWPECRRSVRIARQQRLLPCRAHLSELRTPFSRRRKGSGAALAERSRGWVRLAEPARPPHPRRRKGKAPAGCLSFEFASPPISRVLCPASAGRSRHVRGAATIHLRRRLPGASSDRTRGLAEPAVVPLFGLAPGGVYLASRSPGCWRALTSPFHLCRRFRALAVYFLWHSPSGCPDRVLPGTVLCGARTFLDGSGSRRGCLADSRPDSTPGSREPNPARRSWPWS